MLTFILVIEIKLNHKINIDKNDLLKIIHLLDSNKSNSNIHNNQLIKQLEILVIEKNKREFDLIKQIDELKSEKKFLDDIISNQNEYALKERIKEPQSILNSTISNNETDDSTSSSSSSSSSSPSQSISISIVGLSKNIRHHHHNHMQHQKYDNGKISYEKNLTNNDYADDDEDIVVILDEK